MNIPFTRAIVEKNKATLDADDGHHIVATRYQDGTWNILNEFSAIPTRQCHFDLRRQFINELTGIRP